MSTTGNATRVTEGYPASVAVGETYLEYKQNCSAIQRLGATDPRDLHFSLARRGAETMLGVVRHLWRLLNSLMHTQVLAVRFSKNTWHHKLFLLGTVGSQVATLINQLRTVRAFNLNETERLLFASYNAHHLSSKEKEQLASLQHELYRSAKIITGAETVFNAPFAATLSTKAVTGKNLLYSTNTQGNPITKNSTFVTTTNFHPLYRMYTYALPVLTAAATHAYNSIKLRNRLHTYIKDVLDKARALHEKDQLRLIWDDTIGTTNDKTPNQQTLTAH